MNVRTIMCGLVPIATLLIASTSMGKVLYAYLDGGNNGGEFWTDCNNNNATIEAYSIGYAGTSPICNATATHTGTGSSQSAACSSSGTAHLAHVYSGSSLECTAPTKSGAWDTDFSTGANSTWCIAYFDAKENGTGACADQLPVEAHSMGSEN